MKITFVSFHNWRTKRMGGFHKFAEACVLKGHDVIFFSFARPYFIFFKKEERLNRDVLRRLSKGEFNEISHGKFLLNCTWPTLRAPMPIYKFIPKRINLWLNTHSFGSFNRFQNKFLQGTDVFVFESCDGVFLFDKIRKYNPKAKFIYRPSDPLMIQSASQELVDAEKHILIESDLTLLVNQASLDLYRKRISNFESIVKYKILSNGVDVEKFKLSYPCPELLKGKRSALYVGARIPEWPLVFKAAEENSDITFIIVCPEKCPDPARLSQISNLVFVPGIAPNEVPAWVTNASVIIVPNPKGKYKEKPWGITAKYYQAMAANKPIVAYEDTDELKNYGIWVSHDYDGFEKDLREAFIMERKADVSSYNLDDKNWNYITELFIRSIESVCL